MLPVWGATNSARYASGSYIFQSTLPVWGATGRHALGELLPFISIHAPRVGSDFVSL